MESYLKRLAAELEAAIQGVPCDAMHKAPAGKWNSAQVLEHLYLTYTNTNKGIARCLDGGAPLATRATIKHRVRSLVVIGIGYLPEGAKAPERSVPRGMPLEEVREKIVAEVQEMEAGLDDCERRFGASTKIMDHPLLGPLSANQWRKFHWIHGKHHSRQIRERTKL
ncbi:MAG: DUF1569 domain-containing protein [Terriglobales bacterium]